MDTTQPQPPTSAAAGEPLPPCRCGNPDRFHEPPCPPVAVEPAKPAIPAATLAACALARGEQQPDPSASGSEVRAAWRDLNSKGNGPECYRRRLPAGERAWQWISAERLPRGAFLASDRRATVRGDVYVGDLVATYSRSISRGHAGGRATLDSVQLVVDATEKPLRPCEHRSRRDGQVEVTLPDGTKLVTPSADWR